MEQFIEEWVAPFYLNILHGNYAAKDTRIFDLSVIESLKRITGSWFAGLKRFTSCRDLIGKRLLASEACYAGQSHAFAMACFADAESVVFLEQYLERYLRQKDCYYDQGWVMSALMWIDELNGSEHSHKFLIKGGLWDVFASDKVDITDSWTRVACREQFWRSMSYCREHYIKV